VLGPLEELTWRRVLQEEAELTAHPGLLILEPLDVTDRGDALYVGADVVKKEEAKGTTSSLVGQHGTTNSLVG